jgi:hypothetical protein
MRPFLKFLELYLTVAGLVVTLAAATIASQLATEIYPVIATVAVAVGVVHGCLFFLVRRRQRLVRAETLERVQLMLKDIVNNQLQVLQLADAANRRRPGAVHEGTISESIARISRAVGSISDESLMRWEEGTSDGPETQSSPATAVMGQESSSNREDESFTLEASPGSAGHSSSSLGWEKPSGVHVKAEVAYKATSEG